MKNDIVELMQQTSCGVYIIGVSDGLKENAFTASWVIIVICDVVEAEILKAVASLLHVDTLNLDGGNKNYQ